MINAEELGVTKANVDQMTKNDNPEIKRMLGIGGQVRRGHRPDERLGVPHHQACRATTARSSRRNVGQGSPLKIQRGQNALWTKGGLQYAPPIR